MTEYVVETTVKPYPEAQPVHNAHVVAVEPVPAFVDEHALQLATPVIVVEPAVPPAEHETHVDDDNKYPDGHAVHVKAVPANEQVAQLVTEPVIPVAPVEHETHDVVAGL
jgi:hypothetical protein